MKIIKVKGETKRKDSLIYKSKNQFFRDKIYLKEYLLILVQEVVEKKYKCISGKVTEAVFGPILFTGGSMVKPRRG